jgi:hypothetical protein
MAMYDKQDVAALNIGPEFSSGEVAPTEESVGVAVAGCLLAIDQSVQEQHHVDAVSTLLLGQLAANASADRHGDPVGWYRVYQQTLESVGWVTSVNAALNRYLPSTNQRYTILDVVTDLFSRKTLSEPLVSSMLTAFRSDGQERAQYVFEGPSHGGGQGNFQVAVALEGDDQVLKLHTGRFVFSVPAYVPKILNQQFNSAEARFSSGYTFATLDQGHYAKIRDAVGMKLGDRLSVATQQFTL